VSIIQHDTEFDTLEARDAYDSAWAEAERNLFSAKQTCEDAYITDIGYSLVTWFSASMLVVVIVAIVGGWL
jgi:hypothetical protein